MNANITSMEALEKEQEKLKMLMELTKQEFAQSLGSNRKELKSFLLKNVAIPAGAIGLGLAARKQLSASPRRKSRTSNFSLLGKLLPLGINLAQAYFIKQNQERSAAAISGETPNS